MKRNNSFQKPIISYMTPHEQQIETNFSNARSSVKEIMLQFNNVKSFKFDDGINNPIYGTECPRNATLYLTHMPNKNNIRVELTHRNSRYCQCKVIIRNNGTDEYTARPIMVDYTNILKTCEPLKSQLEFCLTYIR
jgi:hypothetical protein